MRTGVEGVRFSPGENLRNGSLIHSAFSYSPLSLCCGLSGPLGRRSYSLSLGHEGRERERPEAAGPESWEHQVFPLRTRPRGMALSVHKTRCIYQPVLDTLGNRGPETFQEGHHPRSEVCSTFPPAAPGDKPLYFTCVRLCFLI